MWEITEGKKPHNNRYCEPASMVWLWDLFFTTTKPFHKLKRVWGTGPFRGRGECFWSSLKCSFIFIWTKRALRRPLRICKEWVSLCLPTHHNSSPWASLLLQQYLEGLSLCFYDSLECWLRNAIKKHLLDWRCLWLANISSFWRWGSCLLRIQMQFESSSFVKALTFTICYKYKNNIKDWSSSC